MDIYRTKITFSSTPSVNTDDFGLHLLDFGESTAYFCLSLIGSLYLRQLAVTLAKHDHIRIITLSVIASHLVTGAFTVRRHFLARLNPSRATTAEQRTIIQQYGHCTALAIDGWVVI